MGSTSTKWTLQRRFGAKGQEPSSPVWAAPGVMMVTPQWYLGTWEGLELELELVARPYDGTVHPVACRKLTITQAADDSPITTVSIREIPVAALIRQSMRGQAFLAELDDEGKPVVDPDTGETPLRHSSLSDEEAEQIKAEGPTDYSLQWVSWIYHVALLIGVPPTKEVAGALELAQSTAERWVASARARGFLGQTAGAGRPASVRIVEGAGVASASSAASGTATVEHGLADVKLSATGTATVRGSTDFTVNVPTSKPYPDTFYRQVADVYLQLASRTKKPALALAMANTVPVPTARRWIKIARERGFLPMATPGMATNTGTTVIKDVKSGGGMVKHDTRGRVTKLDR